jgi:hypothetical protein
VFVLIVAITKEGRLLMSNNEIIETQLDKHVSNNVPVDLSFIVEEDYDKIKTTPPKR